MRCARCNLPLDPAIADLGHALHPTCAPITASADYLATELFSLIAQGIENTPRSLQRSIGPSEIGTPCQRRLGYKLANVAPVNTSKIGWKAFIGTGVHEMLAQILATNELTRETDKAQRWHVEERVNCGTYGPDGKTLDGSTDLYDAWHGLVLDWKTTTVNKIRQQYRPHGPGEQYEIQAHTYGTGWAAAGYPVNTVAIIFLARDGEYTDRHVWSAPYDPDIAGAALTRLDQTAHLINDLGVDALPLIPTGDAYCNFCPWHAAASIDPRKACPGHPKTSNKIDALHQLIAP